MNTAGYDDEQAQRCVEALQELIAESDYPCIGAKAVMARHQLQCFVCDDIRCPHDDKAIVEFLYEYVESIGKTPSVLCSAAVIFKGPTELSEDNFGLFLWRRLQALADIDATQFAYDPRISGDPASVNFGFSIRSEALYVIGLHPGSSRRARRFSYPAIVFNPHQQFEWLRSTGKYDSMKRAVRRRDEVYAGSVNPMLADFGVSSEAIQYSGKQYGNNWTCPFVSKHQRNENHSSKTRSGVLTEEG